MVQPLVEYVAATVFDLVAAERCLIVLYGADGQIEIPVARDRQGQPIGDAYDQISRSILERAHTTCAPVLVSDALEDTTFRRAQSVRNLSIRSMICVPLIAHERSVGAIYVENRTAANQFFEDHLLPLVLLADQVVVALENARRHEALERSVAVRSRELSQALDRLRLTQRQLVHTEKLAALGNLVAGVAHELRNPLNFVISLSQLSIGLAEELEAAAGSAGAAPSAAMIELLAYLERNCREIHLNGQRAEAIISGMLLQARGDAQRFERVDLNALLHQSTQLAYHSVRARKPDAREIAVLEQLDASIPLIEALPQRLGQAFINLIDNACYALWERQASDAAFAPTLRISSAEMPDHVQVQIWDNGVGILPELRSTLFEPFVTSKPPGEGTGLGLALTYEIIVHGHAGAIQVASAPGEYTEFTIRLPIHAVGAESQRSER